MDYLLKFHKVQSQGVALIAGLPFLLLASTTSRRTIGSPNDAQSAWVDFHIH
jgi:hypothetical protein